MARAHGRRSGAPRPSALALPSVARRAFCSTQNSSNGTESILDPAPRCVPPLRAGLCSMGHRSICCCMPVVSDRPFMCMAADAGAARGARLLFALRLPPPTPCRRWGSTAIRDSTLPQVTKPAWQLFGRLLKAVDPERQTGPHHRMAAQRATGSWRSTAPTLARRAAFGLDAAQRAAQVARVSRPRFALCRGRPGPHVS